MGFFFRKKVRKPVEHRSSRMARYVKQHEKESFMTDWDWDEDE